MIPMGVESTDAARVGFSRKPEGDRISSAITLRCSSHVLSNFMLYKTLATN